LRDMSMLRNVLVGILVATLIVVGIGILLFVAIGWDRLFPDPTPVPPTALPPTWTPLPPPPTGTPVPRGTVLGRVKEYEPGALIIVISPIEGDAEQIIVPENIIVTHATGERSSPMAIAVGQILYAEGVIDTIGRIIADRIVITQFLQPTDTAVPPTATALPPTPTPERVWLGEYYANGELSGEPAMTRRDALIDYRWDMASPGDGLPEDGFSVRWSGRWELDAGSYRFNAYVDDGVRIWVDGDLVMDQWRSQPVTLFQADHYVTAGFHDIDVEYFEGTGEATIRVWWDNRGSYPEWKGEYFANRDVAGEASWVRNDAQVEFDWGQGSPSDQIPVDDFSVRWTRTLSFTEGTYRFLAHADDGVRLWIDGRLIIDEWHSSQPKDYDGHAWLVGGPHDLRVEYQEQAGNASLRVWWERVEDFPDWRGEYFDNPDLAGEPAVVRNDEAVAFDWDLGSPQNGLPVDNFSVRWRRAVSLTEGRYLFWAIADDGVRLYVDGQRIIDSWYDSPSERYEGSADLSSGVHDIVVEYYERGDQASISMGWSLVMTPTPFVTPTSTESPMSTEAPPTRLPVDTFTPTPGGPSDTPTPTLAPKVTRRLKDE